MCVNRGTRAARIYPFRRPPGRAFMTGCLLDISRGTAYGLSLSQMALALGCVLFFPAVQVQVFTPEPVLANGTLAGGNGLVASGLVHVGLGLPLLVSAACTLWFSGATMALHDQGALSSDYVRESLEGTGIWDVM
jgi:hypothetical protein